MGNVKTCARWELNPRHLLYKNNALTPELLAQVSGASFYSVRSIDSSLCSDKLSPKMAHQIGLEPMTLGLEGRCSIQLSYWCLILYYYNVFAYFVKGFSARIEYFKVGEMFEYSNLSNSCSVRSLNV